MEDFRPLLGWISSQSKRSRSPVSFARWVKAPTDDELSQLTHIIAQRIARFLERDGENSYLASDAVDDDPMETWAQRLQRVFNIDVETCRACSMTMDFPEKGLLFCLYSLAGRCGRFRLDLEASGHNMYMFMYIENRNDERSTLDCGCTQQSAEARS